MYSSWVMIGKENLHREEDKIMKFDFLKDYCEVVYLPRTEGISTTQLKEELKG